jgi:hypothetical protein
LLKIADIFVFQNYMPFGEPRKDSGNITEPTQDITNQRRDDTGLFFPTIRAVCRPV